MTIHPPSLYTGYVGCAVPFAFAMAALATGKLDDVWIRTTRRWTLLAWFFLSLGNLFGAEWAYLVLGWGGYWAWDPVENAAFMPWLTCTAFLHSVMIQEKKNMLKVWNMVLVILTFALTIFGTFLTRSGVISSVHSFTQSGLGPFFIGFLGFMLAVSLGLLIWRLPLLRSENELDSMLSRESAFLLNNLDPGRHRVRGLLGHGLPGDLGSGARRQDHRRPAVLQPGERAARPGPAVPHRGRAGDRLAARLGAQSAEELPDPAGARASSPASCSSSPACATTTPSSRSRCAPSCMATIVMEFYRGVRARQAMIGENVLTALTHLIGKNRRRYGGYIIHIGIVMMFLAITGTSAFKQEQQITVKPGDTLPDRWLHAALRRRRAARDAAHRLPDGPRRGAQGRQADRHAHAGEALLQEAGAADDRGRDPLDAGRRSLPGARAASTTRRTWPRSRRT